MITGKKLDASFANEQMINGCILRGSFATKQEAIEYAKKRGIDRSKQLEPIILQNEYGDRFCVAYIRKG